MCTFERPDLYYWAGWLWNFSGLNERLLPHVGYLLMSSLNVYFLSGLCTFERSDFLHFTAWLWTFNRPDYEHLSGLTMCLWVACVPLSGLVRCTARGCLPLMVDLVLPNLNSIDVIVPQLVGKATNVTCDVRCSTATTFNYLTFINQ